MNILNRYMSCSEESKQLHEQWRFGRLRNENKSRRRFDDAPSLFSHCVVLSFFRTYCNSFYKKCSDLFEEAPKSNQYREVALEC